jgi:hypothetical protein
LSGHRYVVLAQRVRGFDDFERAKEYATANVPAVICERKVVADGTRRLVEVMRHDFLYDEDRDEWRVMMG